MIEENIFSLLFKCARRQAENYFSKSFVLVLSHLLNSNNNCKLAAIEILNETFAHRLAFHFGRTENISIESHVKTTKNNIPDITIQAADQLIYVEIKVDSPVDKEARRRIRNYLNDLETETRKNGLILVTRSGNEDVGNLIPSEQQTSWFTISRALGRALKQLIRSEETQSLTVCLLEKFYDFLKERGMAILKVDNKFDSATVHNMTKLLQMLQEVSKSKLGTNRPWFEPGASTKDDQSYLGYSDRKDGNYAIRIYPEEDITKQLYFEIHERDEIERLFGDRGDMEPIPEIDQQAVLWKEDGVIGVTFNLDESFLGEGASGEHQRKMLEDFIDEMKTNWERIKKRRGRKSR